MDTTQLKNIIEAALLAADQPLNFNQLVALFPEDEAPPHSDIRAAIGALEADCEERGIELKQVASGWRLQVKAEMQPWISRMWAERPPRYSRALLETLALIAYRQPITRGEIEQIRGVSVSTNIMRTLQEREWVRIVGHRDVPGRPALFGTTKRFLDYFNLKRLDELPTLAEIKDIDALEPELEWQDDTGDGGPPTASPDAESDLNDAIDGHPGDEPGDQRDHQSDMEPDPDSVNDPDLTEADNSADAEDDHETQDPRKDSAAD